MTLTETITDYVNTIGSYFTGGLFFTVGVAITTVFLSILALMFIGKSKKLTLWHGLAIATGAFFAATIINSATNLIDWLALGLSGYSIGALIFVIGMVAMIGVMAFNLIATKGRTLIR